MRDLRAGLVGSMLVAAVFAACGDDAATDGGGEAGAPATGGTTATGGAAGTGGGAAGCVTFDEVDAQIFTPYCAACHGGSAANGAVRVDTQSGAESRAAQIVDAIASGRMPQGGPRLSSDLAVLASSWAACVP